MGDVVIVWIVQAIIAATIFIIRTTVEGISRVKEVAFRNPC